MKEKEICISERIKDFLRPQLSCFKGCAQNTPLFQFAYETSGLRRVSRTLRTDNSIVFSGIFPVP